jgi:hypothetical protein
MDFVVFGMNGQINYHHSAPEERNVLSQTVNSPEDYGGDQVYVDMLN